MRHHMKAVAVLLVSAGPRGLGSLASMLGALPSSRRELVEQSVRSPGGGFAEDEDRRQGRQVRRDQAEPHDPRLFQQIDLEPLRGIAAARSTAVVSRVRNGL
jgi:hypothetical protein